MSRPKEIALWIVLTVAWAVFIVVTEAEAWIRRWRRRKA